MIPSVDGTGLTWTALPGRTYRVQFKASIEESEWSDVPGDVTAVAATATKTDEAAPPAARRFYRVVRFEE